MNADTTAIRSELEQMPDLPTPVRSWLVKNGLDATDEPAVWVWALIEDQNADADSLERLETMAWELVRRRTGLWAYVLIRGADEPGADS